MLTASDCRRAGMSSMPLRARSKSPRRADWSRLEKATCTNCGARPDLRATSSAISTSKPTTRVGSVASAST
jgi:ribosomal protein L40E